MKKKGIIIKDFLDKNINFLMNHVLIIHIISFPYIYFLKLQNNFIIIFLYIKLNLLLNNQISENKNRKL